MFCVHSLLSCSRGARNLLNAGLNQRQGRGVMATNKKRHDSSQCRHDQARNWPVGADLNPLSPTAADYRL